MSDANRMISKKFKCQNCNKTFKKLVQIYVDYTRCPNCELDQCPEEVEPNEFNRENIDGSYNLNFDNMSKSTKKQYHTVTDTRDKNKNNFYGDSQRNRIFF